MAYSTTKAVINKLLPGTLSGFRGYRGVRGFSGVGLGTGISLSGNAMLGLALGSVGMVFYLKNQHKLKGLGA